MVSTKIGEKIRELRISKMMTQTDLAGEYITRNMLSNIERGTAMPSLQTMLYLAEKLKVPVGYLLSEESADEFAYRKMSRIADIRSSFAQRNYKSCRSICVSELNGVDDEIAWILAECDIGLAEECFLEGKLRSTCRYLDEALRYAGQTLYRTDYVKAMGSLYFRYLNVISQTLFSEVTDIFSTDEAFYSGEISRYMLAYFAVKAKHFDKIDSYLNEAGFENSIFSMHILVQKLMLDGKYPEAEKKLTEIMKADLEIPPILLYHFCMDLETCNRELGNYKAAYELAQSKVRLLERLLEEV